MKRWTILGFCYPPLPLSSERVREALASMLDARGLRSVSLYGVRLSESGQWVEVRAPSGGTPAGGYHHDVAKPDYTIIVWSNRQSTEITPCKGLTPHTMGHYSPCAGPRYTAFPHGAVVAFDDCHYLHRTPPSASDRWFARAYIVGSPVMSLDPYHELYL